MILDQRVYHFGTPCQIWSNNELLQFKTIKLNPNDLSDNLIIVT